MRNHRGFSNFSYINVLRCFLVLVAIGVLVPASSIGSGMNPAQPLLFALAAQHPDDILRLIVQKWGQDSAVEDSVIDLGGQVINDLPIINAFVAELPAGLVPTLAQSQGVRWISVDAPVVHSGILADSAPETQPAHRVLLPLIMQDNGQLQSNQDESLVFASGRKDCSSCPPNYYLATLEVQPVREMGIDGRGIGVAVIDSGISNDKDFTQLKKTKSLNRNSHTPNDVYGHGTHLAGIIAGNGTDSQGHYQGIAPGVSLISLKVSDETGQAYESDTVAAMQWVLENKAAYNIRVVNLSINSSVEQSYHTSPLDAAAEILWFNGIVVVASAGNAPSSGYNPIRAAPANDPFIITVGASDENSSGSSADDFVASYSAYGVTEDGFAKPDIIAPGSKIISVLSRHSLWATQHPARVVYEKEYFRLSGTSMAAPMVTGAVALLLQQEPNLTPDQVKYRLLNASNLIAGGASTIYPYLNVYKAIANDTVESANTGLVASQLLWTGSTPVTWGSVNWNSVNWNSVNWNSVNWNSVNWNSVNWNSVDWSQ